MFVEYPLTSKYLDKTIQEERRTLGISKKVAFQKFQKRNQRDIIQIDQRKQEEELE
jgi:hypothetical protein